MVVFVFIVSFFLMTSQNCESQEGKAAVPEASEALRLGELSYREGRATLLEWDANVPKFPVLQDEVRKARRYRSREQARARWVAA